MASSARRTSERFPSSCGSLSKRDCASASIWLYSDFLSVFTEACRQCFESPLTIRNLPVSYQHQFTAFAVRTACLRFAFPFNNHVWALGSAAASHGVRPAHAFWPAIHRSLTVLAPFHRK